MPTTVMQQYFDHTGIGHWDDKGFLLWFAFCSVWPDGRATRRTMLTLVVIAKWAGLLLLGGFLGVVLWKLATGNIALDQLFEGDIRDADPANAEGYTTQVSAGRVQTFWVTVLVAAYYVGQVIQNPTELPRLPNGMIAALAGSHALYLGGKAQAMYLGRIRDLWR